jgi:type III secretory pathway component EscU
MIETSYLSLVLGHTETFSVHSILEMTCNQIRRCLLSFILVFTSLPLTSYYFAFASCGNENTTNYIIS